MHIRTLRRFTAIGALALASMVAGACGSEPVRAGPEAPVAAGAGAPATTAPGVTAPGTQSPTAPDPRPPAGSAPVCLGAVIYTVDASAGGRPWRSLCIAVGGLLLLEHLGPGDLAARSWDNVDCDYEGAVHACRLIHLGTVNFTVTNNHGVRALTVVVAKASSPPKPSPACTSTVAHNLDANSGGPPWWAFCVKVGAVLRVENLGPEGLSVDVPNVVSCRYEAAVHECTFVRPGTVRVTTRRSAEDEPRTVTVVVIR